MLERIVDGRTDLIFEYLAAGHSATSRDENGVSLLQWCAYYGDVSAIVSGRTYQLAQLSGVSPFIIFGVDHRARIQ